MTKLEIKLIIAIVVGLLLASGYIPFVHSKARAKESAILHDVQIIGNYRKFQETASAKRIAYMPNRSAKEVPEIKKILDERDALLAKTAYGCKMEYMAGIGITSSTFEPIKVRCDASSWWKW